MANKTLAEVKATLKTDHVIEIDTGFLVNDYGKFRPNITFVISKVFDANPLSMRSDEPTRKMLANMNLLFSGNTSVLFGDFWTSGKGKSCFRPKPIADARHVLIYCGWGGAFNRTRGISGIGGVGDALYFRSAASNGGGLGADYLVVPVGYYRVVRDTEIDGQAGQSVPDFAERAKAIRNDYAKHDREVAEKAAAEAKAKSDAEAASRAARKGELGARMEAVNSRLRAIGESSYELRDSSFGSEFSPQLYTEHNVAFAESKATEAEAESALRHAVEQLRVEFATHLAATDSAITLSNVDCCWKEMKISTNDEAVSRSVERSLAGVEELRKAFPGFFAEVETRHIEAQKAAEKAALEESLRKRGYPTDFTCIHERGHGKTHRQCWVIGADGKEREADEEVYSRHKHVATKWNVIRPGEIALVWEKGSTANDHRFSVKHMLTEKLTNEQIETICSILEGIEERWESARGLASGRPSPDVGEGWLHPVTEESLTKGFKTSRQRREAGSLPRDCPDLDEPIKAIQTVKSVAEGGEAASQDALAALLNKFSK